MRKNSLVWAIVELDADGKLLNVEGIYSKRSLFENLERLRKIYVGRIFGIKVTFVR